MAVVKHCWEYDDRLCAMVCIPVPVLRRGGRYECQQGEGGCGAAVPELAIARFYGPGEVMALQVTCDLYAAGWFK